MEMASDQSFLGSTWHRPEAYASLSAGASDMAPSSESFYRHHGMDTGSAANHGGYFNSRAAMHGFRSSGELKDAAF